MPKRSFMAQIGEAVATEKLLLSGVLCQYVTVKQAASLLQVSERTVRRLIANGELSAYRLHGMVRIRWSAVEWLMKRY